MGNVLVGQFGLWVGALDGSGGATLRKVAKPVMPLILIVDDNSAVRDVLKTILTRWTARRR